jgi:outer membrane protein TolC
LQRNNQLQPATNFLTPVSTRTDAFTSSVSMAQRLAPFGTSYSVAWDTSHTDSNSVLNSFNPLLRSGLSLNVSQPLLKDFRLDQPRVQRTITSRNREIADITVRESMVQTTAAVKNAYWNLVSAAANLDARKSALDLAQELARVNRAKVDVGQSPPLDFAAAEAEVASDQEQLIVAEAAVRQAEDRLRVLIFDPTRRDVWALTLRPTDAPTEGTIAVDLEAAVTTALRERTDLTRARKDLENAATNIAFSDNQRLPDVRLNAMYQANALGGTQLVRSGGFPGTVVGAGQATAFSAVMDQLLRNQYPTWSVGVSVSYPIGQSAAEATYAKSQLEHDQTLERIKRTEGHVIQQVREAGWRIEMNAKRIDATRAARTLAEQRLDAERKRFDVGLSTSFLVIQAQRDMAQAKQNELAAILAYDLALVEFESVQQAAPAP